MVFLTHSVNIKKLMLLRAVSNLIANAVLAVSVMPLLLAYRSSFSNK